MSLQLEWVGIAEGAVFDTRKALTLVGVNQNLIRADGFPFAWQTTIVIVAAEDYPPNDSAELTATLAIEIVDPSEKTILANTNQVKVERAESDLPGSMLGAALVALQFSEEGRYRVSVALTPDNKDATPSERHKDIYVKLNTK